MAQIPPKTPSQIGPRDPYLPLRQVMVEIIAAHAEATHDVTGLARIRASVIEAMLSVP
ncbi:MAG: hypothetical protein K0Q70_2520, partial [Rhodospirillales bacterium]|nr:hypothetical protein [Rhodospirillales bacterium]